jgi:hypothetical protein
VESVHVIAIYGFIISPLLPEIDSVSLEVLRNINRFEQSKWLSFQPEKPVAQNEKLVLDSACAIWV